MQYNYVKPTNDSKIIKNPYPEINGKDHFKVIDDYSFTSNEMCQKTVVIENAKSLKVSNALEGGGASQTAIVNDDVTDVIIGSITTELKPACFKGYSALKSIDLTNAGITGIPNGCFIDCRSLDHIDRNEKITSIGDYAFSGCESLKSAEFPKAQSIGNYAFENCKKLPVAYMVNEMDNIPEHAFSGCESLLSVIGGKNINIINAYAFNECRKLSSINLKNLNTIRQYSFNNCNSLISADFSNVTYIDSYAFNGCNKLRFVNLSNTIYIGSNAFNGTFNNENNLIHVSLDSIQTLGEGAFLGCTSISSIGLGINLKHPESKLKINPIVFKDCSRLSTICYGANLKYPEEYESPILSNFAVPELIPSESFQIDNIFSGLDPNWVMVVPPHMYFNFVEDEKWGRYTNPAWRYGDDLAPNQRIVTTAGFVNGYALEINPKNSYIFTEAPENATPEQKLDAQHVRIAKATKKQGADNINIGIVKVILKANLIKPTKTESNQ